MRNRKCSECPEVFEPRVDSQLTCSAACAAKRRQKYHAAYQREKWRSDPGWRKKRIAANYSRIKRRAAKAKISVNKLRKARA